jgi:hypothetical protein
MAQMTKMRRAMLGAIGAGALVVTAACGASGGVGAAGTETGLMPAAQMSAQSANGQVLVNCEPHQRTLVRQVVVNGQPMAQVECVAVDAPAAYSTASYPAAAAPVRDYGYDTRVVQPAPVYREVAPRRVSTQPRVVTERAPSGRSWKKSAIIIGSSAGVGAGVGAAVGGKKGALIGAAVGGGGAAIWDQVTRKK